MPTGGSARSAVGALKVWTTAHPASAVAIAFLALRALDLAVFALLARLKDARISDVVVSWDADWLQAAAKQGWPDHLPLDGDGVAQSTWNWPFGVPLAVRALSSLTAGGRATGGFLVLLSLAGGTVAAMVLCRALAPHIGAPNAVGSAIAWSALPATPIFLMGYSEGMFVAFAFASLWAATRNRYLLAAMLLLPAGAIRVTALPFAVAVCTAMVLFRRRGGAVSVARMTAVTLISLAASFLWPAYAALRLGRVDAYAEAQSAWGRSALPFHDAVQWVRSALSAPTADTIVVGAVLAAYLLAAVVVVRDRRFPDVFRVLAAASPVLLLIVGPGWSTPRQLTPDPALGMSIRKWVPRLAPFVVVVGLLCLLRVGWILMYVTASPGSPPP